MVSNDEIKRRLERKRRGLDEVQLEKKSIKYKTCPSCRFKNPESSIFCVKCGKKLEKNVDIKCNTCGTLNPETAKFCIKCGNNLTIKETSNNENLTIDTEKIKTEDENDLINKKTIAEPNPENNQNDTINQKSIPDVQTVPNESDNEKSGKKSMQNFGLPSSIPDQNLINPQGNKKTCPTCGSKNLKPAKFCVVCGEKFIDASIEKSVIETDPNVNDNKENSKTGEIDDPIEKIKKAKELLDIGAITEEEFESIKSKYLDKV
jgi:hypothetical protein